MVSGVSCDWGEKRDHAYQGSLENFSTGKDGLGCGLRFQRYWRELFGIHFFLRRD